MAYLLPIQHYVLTFGFEGFLVLIALVWAFRGPDIPPKWFHRVGEACTYLSSRPRLAILTIFVVSLLARAATLPVDPISKPVINDEFCYLLQAETFAAGKATNPTHPMWQHFESFHIFHLPSYQAKYPPIQGMILAAGQVIFGHPWYGVWISCACMCAAVCWMLYGWLPPRWALMGGFLCVLRLGLLNYWCSSYWGGAVAAIGGALALGALARILKRPQMLHGFLLGVSLVILANSRPYEGLILALPMAFFIVRKIFELGFSKWQTSLFNLVLPVCLVLLLGGTAMTLYFRQVTGKPFLMPYTVHQQIYEVASPFYWQSNRPEPEYNHQVLRDCWAGDYAQTLGNSITIASFLRLKALHMLYCWAFYVRFVFLLPLFFLPWVLRDKRMRILVVIAGFSTIGLLFEKPLLMHYVAPQTALFYALLVQAMRHLKVWQRHRSAGKVGQRLTQAIPLICVLVFFGDVAFNAAGINTVYLYPSAHGTARASIVEALEDIPGKHLVMVRYGPNHIHDEEWVYNRADINQARIVWAREMGQVKNRDLFAYFKDRSLWILEADERPPILVPYRQNSNGNQGYLRPQQHDPARDTQ